MFASVWDDGQTSISKGFYPKEGDIKSRWSTLFGDTGAPDLRNEGAYWTRNSSSYPATEVYSINKTQAVMIKQYMSATPQHNWALTANCTDWAVGAAKSGGIYISRSSYTTFGYADPAKLERYMNAN